MMNYLIYYSSYPPRSIAFLFLFFFPLFSIHDEDKILALFEKNGHKKFRYSQLENAIYKNLIKDFSFIETLPKDIRDLLSANCFYTSLTLHSEKLILNDRLQNFFSKHMMIRWLRRLLWGIFRVVILFV